MRRGQGAAMALVLGLCALLPRRVGAARRLSFLRGGSSVGSAEAGVGEVGNGQNLAMSAMVQGTLMGAVGSAAGAATLAGMAGNAMMQPPQPPAWALGPPQNRIAMGPPTQRLAMLGSSGTVTGTGFGPAGRPFAESSMGNQATGYGMGAARGYMNSLGTGTVLDVRMNNPSTKVLTTDPVANRFVPSNSFQPGGTTPAWGGMGNNMPAAMPYVDANHQRPPELTPGMGGSTYDRNQLVMGGNWGLGGENALKVMPRGGIGFSRQSGTAPGYQSNRFVLKGAGGQLDWRTPDWKNQLGITSGMWMANPIAWNPAARQDFLNEQQQQQFMQPIGLTSGTRLIRQGFGNPPIVAGLGIHAGSPERNLRIAQNYLAQNEIRQSKSQKTLIKEKKFRDPGWSANGKGVEKEKKTMNQ